jgi:hypothetical protein
MAAPLQTLTRIRQMIAKRLGYTLDSSSTITMFNDEINMALGDLHDAAPDAFDHEEEEVDLLKVIDLGDLGVGVKIPSSHSPPAIINDRVLEFRTAADGTLTDWVPNILGTWDGRYWLRVNTADGQSFDIQSREWWREAIVGSVPLTYAYYVSIVDPCPFDAISVVTNVIIYQKHLWFPGDTREVKPYPYETREGREAPIEEVQASTAAKYLTYRNNIGSSTSDLRVIWRENKFALPDPIATPLIHAGESGWASPIEFPQVQIEACYTIRWGKRTDMVEAVRPRGIQEPLWESAPSPIATFDPSVIATPSVVFEAYNVDAALGFDDNLTLGGTTFRGRSGMRIAWWIRVVALKEDGGKYKNIPTNERFYLLTEVEPTASVTVSGVPRYGAYEWDGSVVPDFEVPLVPSVGYYGYGYHGMPDADTSLRCRVRRVPHEMTHDYHYVKLKRPGLNALFYKVMSQIQRIDGDESAANNSETRYYEAAANLAANEGSTAGEIVPGSIRRSHPYQPRSKVTIA